MFLKYIAQTSTQTRLKEICFGSSLDWVVVQQHLPLNLNVEQIQQCHEESYVAQQGPILDPSTLKDNELQSWQSQKIETDLTNKTPEAKSLHTLLEKAAKDQPHLEYFVVILYSKTKGNHAMAIRYNPKKEKFELHTGPEGRHFVFKTETAFFGGFASAMTQLFNTHQERYTHIQLFTLQSLQKDTPQ